MSITKRLKRLAQCSGVVVGATGRGGSGTCVQLEDGPIALLTAKHVVIECLRNTGRVAIAAYGKPFGDPLEIRMDSSQAGDAAYLVFQTARTPEEFVPFSKWTTSRTDLVLGQRVIACGYPGAFRAIEENTFKSRFFCFADKIMDIQHGINKTKRAVAQPNINAKELASLPIPLPSIPEQRRIVDILSRAEGIVRLRRDAENKAAELIPALFLDMFGDPATNPKGWAKFPLLELGKILTGTTPPSAEIGMFGGDIPFITPGDLTVDTANTKRFVTSSGAQKSRTVQAGSTLVCCIGATIGKTDRTWKLSAFNQQINAIEWNESIVHDYGLVCMKLCETEVIRNGSSTALPILKKSLFEKIRIPVPLLIQQNIFAEHIQRIRAIQSQQAAATATAQATFDALLAQVFHK